MRSNSIRKHQLATACLTLAATGLIFTQTAFCADATYDHVTVNNSMGVGGATPTTTQGIFIYHQNYGPGNANIYAYRAGSPSGTTTSTSWDVNTVESCIKAYSAAGDTFSAAIAAYSNITAPNSTALIAGGTRYGTQYTAYLGYMDASLTPWAGYFLGNSYFSGTTRLQGNVGIGASPSTTSGTVLLVSGKEEVTNGLQIDGASPGVAFFTVLGNAQVNGQLALGNTPTTDNSFNLVVALKSQLNGNVGIGGAPSATTTTKLAVTGDGTVSGNLGLGSAPSSSYRLLVTGNESVTGTLTATSETVSGLSTLNGNVGIGGAPSATTTTKLAVTGDGTVSGNLGLGSAPSSSYRLLVTGNESVTGTLTATSETVSGLSTLNGNVGIGITPSSSSTNKLDVNGNAAVNGTLNAKAITVASTVSPWPDFVFNRNYEAKPLSETEKYVKENGHLPGMPSKDEVAKNGINVGEMQAKMLKTIEEMTLQMIAL